MLTTQYPFTSDIKGVVLTSAIRIKPLRKHGASIEPALNDAVSSAGMEPEKRERTSGAGMEPATRDPISRMG
jgi:hypothetical protein